jgi:hypothetical protein
MTDWESAQCFWYERSSLHSSWPGFDPAIQSQRQTAIALGGWMAASMAGLNPAIRAAMTGWIDRDPSARVLAAPAFNGISLELALAPWFVLRERVAPG